MDIKDITAVVAILLGLYQIWVGFRAHRATGFRFHILGGFLTGIPFLLIGAILLWGRGRWLGGWAILLLFMWLAGIVWRGWQVQQAGRQTESDVVRARSEGPKIAASRDTIIKDD